MKVLDCTIRDGSYVTNYHWDKDVLRRIVSTLSGLGVKLIEIGNGTGLGAFRKIADALPDDKYFESCIPYKASSMIGAFFIPGIGSKDDLKHFREVGGDFVRIGANVNALSSTYEYIDYAKSLGFFVCCNMMKTYAVSRFSIVRQTEEIVKCGADCVYLVDSAGGMLPDQVSDYVKAIKEFYCIPVGFHGHNNLLMANANSLKALQSGADYVDATLRGLGRGAGNAQLESLIAICKKAGILTSDINVLKLADLAEEIMGSLNLKGSTKREINIGIANFHDSYTRVLEETASRYGVNPELLMTEVCKYNIIDPSIELFEFAAKQIVEGKELKFVPAYSHTNY